MSETAETLQDRIAAKFSPETNEPDVSENVEQELPEADPSEQPEVESAGEEGASAEFEEVEYEGRKYQVPPELKDALMAKSDYTTKTTETARLRDTLTQQQQEVALYQEQRAFEQSVSDDMQRLNMLDQYIKHTKENTNWGEMSTEEIVRGRLEIDQLQEQRNELRQALEGKRNEFAQKLQAERQKLKQQADEVLGKAIPNYTPEVKKEIEQYVVERGYPEVAIQNMTALDYQIAWEASQYRKLKSGTAAAKRNAANAPPVVKPGASNPMPQDVRKNLQFKKDMDKARKANVSEAQKARIIQKRLEEKLGG